MAERFERPARPSPDAAAAVQDRATERLARLYTLTTALSGAVSAQDVVAMTVRQGTAALGAVAGVLVLVQQDGTLETTASFGLPLKLIDSFRRFPLDARIPLADAARSGEPVWLESLAERNRRYPSLAAVATSNEASASIPLRLGPRIVGALGLSFARARRFTPEDQGFLLALGRLCALALDRLRLARAAGEPPGPAEAALGGADGAAVALDVLLAAAPIGLAVMDTELRYVRINSFMATINGRSVAEHLGRRMHEVAHPALAEAAEPIVRQVLDDGAPVCDVEIAGPPQATGPELTWLASYYPVTGPGGKVSGVGAVVTDISGRKAAEQALAESEARLRLALDAARMGTFDWDLRTGALRWNCNHARIFGIDLAAFNGTYPAFIERIHPDDVEAVDAQIARAIEVGGSFEVEYRVARADGTARWALSRGQVVLDEAGKPAQVTGTTLDTTDSRSVRERIARAFESISDGFCAFDRGWRLTYANREAQRVLGRSGAELLGRPLHDTLPAPLGVAFQREYERAVTDSTVVEFEAFYPDLDAWFEVRAYPSVDGLFVYLHDVSARKAVEAERTRLLAAERETRAALDRMLSLTPTFHAEDLGATDLAETICRAAARTFACPWASLWELEGERARLVAAAPARAGGVSVAVGAVAGLAGDLAARRPVFRTEAAGAPLRTGAGAGAGAGAEPGTEAEPTLRVPITIGTRAEALLVLGLGGAAEAPSTAMLTVVQRFADQAALAIEQARTREVQSEVAALSARLQAGLLPTPAVTDPRLSIDTRYQAGEHRLLLGGDFFDAVELSDGSLAVLIGDVSGHGADAAALGATLRAAWRGLALTLADPLALTRALHAVFLAEGPSEEAFATVCCALVPPDRASATFVVAGHPRPLLLAGGVDPVDLDCGPPLGLGGDGDWAAATVALSRSWALLFYTDGLVEARSDPDGSDRFGEQGLIKHLAELPDPAALDGSGLDTVLAHVQELSGERFADDVAVVLIRHHPDPA
jgi:PAS domain S-box-containing protein